MNKAPRPTSSRRSRRPGLVLGVVAVLGALPLITLWLGGHSLAQRTAGKDLVSIGALNTPVLSTRRTAQNIVNEISRDALANDLSNVAEKLPAKACLKVSRGRTAIFNKRSDLQLIPGSNQKIVTAAAAATLLPEATVFTTRVFGKVDGSKVAGNILLVGGGDPLLTTSDYAKMEKFPTLKRTSLEALAQRVFDAGVRTVDGSVVGNDDLLSRSRYVDSWGSGVRGVEGGPLGALMVNDGVVVSNPIKPDDPSLAAATEFTRALRNVGIVVTGEPSSNGKLVEGASEIAKSDSAPLIDVIAEMLTNSDNNTAELILKEIGLARLSAGTRVAGAQVVQSVLQEFGLPTDGLVIVDGSGLDRGNRATCSLFASVLERDGGFGVLGNGLAIAGQTGTLRDLLGDSVAGERLRAKTGTLTGAKALSGYVVYAPEKAATFALILNGSGVSNQGEYRPIWNGLANALGALTEHPSVTDIAP